jgi:hypothetical protein
MLPTQKPACPVVNVFPGAGGGNADAGFVAAVKIDMARSVAIIFFMSRSPYVAMRNVESNLSKFRSVLCAHRTFAPNRIAELVAQANAKQVRLKFHVGGKARDRNIGLAEIDIEIFDFCRPVRR